MRHTLTGILLAAAILAGCQSAPTSSASVAAEPAVQGYRPLESGYQVPDRSRVEVLVIFGYQCAHCYRFLNEQLAGWMQQQPADVRVRFLPTAWTDRVRTANRAFHAAEAMGANPAFHRALFDRFQQDEASLRKPGAMARLAADCCRLQGRRLQQQMRARSTDERLSAAAATQRQLNITGTPTVVVNGKYLVSPETGSPTPQAMMRTIDRLVQQERAALVQPPANR